MNAEELQQRQKTLEMEEKTIIAIPPDDLKSAFKKMIPFMSTEETRHYLCGIYCHYDYNRLTLCATNGHILCEIIKDVEPCEDGDFAIILPAMAVKHLVKVIPKTKVCPYLLVKVAPGGKDVEFESNDFSYTTKAVDGDFPAYKELVPEGSTKMREGLRAGYLMAALKALGDIPIDIATDGHNDATASPHLLTSQKEDGIRCVVMPVRSGE